MSLGKYKYRRFGYLVSSLPYPPQQRWIWLQTANTKFNGCCLLSFCIPTPPHRHQSSIIIIHQHHQDHVPFSCLFHHHGCGRGRLRWWWWWWWCVLLKLLQSSSLAGFGQKVALPSSNLWPPQPPGLNACRPDLSIARSYEVVLRPYSFSTLYYFGSGIPKSQVHSPELPATNPFPAGLSNCFHWYRFGSQ